MSSCLRSLPEQIDERSGPDRQVLVVEPDMTAVLATDRGGGASPDILAPLRCRQLGLEISKLHDSSAQRHALDARDVAVRNDVPSQTICHANTVTPENNAMVPAVADHHDANRNRDSAEADEYQGHAHSRSQLSDRRTGKEPGELQHPTCDESAKSDDCRLNGELPPLRRDHDLWPLTHANLLALQQVFQRMVHDAERVALRESHPDLAERGVRDPLIAVPSDLGARQPCGP